jgi:hypothetical protein
VEAAAMVRTCLYEHCQGRGLTRMTLDLDPIPLLRSTWAQGSDRRSELHFT